MVAIVSFDVYMWHALIHNLDNGVLLEVKQIYSIYKVTVKLKRKNGMFQLKQNPLIHCTREILTAYNIFQIK